MTGSAPSLWHNRDFLILRSGQAVSGLGSQMSRVAMPLLVLSLTRSPALTGMVALVSSLPALLLGLPLGALVDRWDRRQVLMISSIGLAVGTGSVGIALLTGHLTLLHILVAGLVSSICGTAFSAAESASIPQVVSRDQLSAALAQNEAVVRASQLVGPPIGGELFGLARALPFLADAISYWAIIAALTGLRTPLGSARRRGTRGPWTEVVEGFSWVRHQPFVRTTLLLTAGSNLLLTAVYLLVIVLARKCGASPSAIGLIFTFEAVFAIGGTLLAPYLSRRLTMTQTVIGSCWIWMALLPIYLLSNNVLAIGAITGAIFCLSPIRNVILIGYQMRIIPDEIRGRVGGVAGLITAGPMPFGSAACGLLLQYAGMSATVLSLTLGMLVLALTASGSRSIRRP